MYVKPRAKKFEFRPISVCHCNHIEVIMKVLGPLFKIVLCTILQAGVFRGAPYTLDDSGGLGRRFDGIGGISAGVSDYMSGMHLEHVTVWSCNVSGLANRL